MTSHYDVAVLGGGILGLATALALSERDSSLRLAVVEKEREVGEHQTGHNSGVIHSGVYYRPGSLKAQLCVDGAQRMVRFCQAQDVPYQRTGKVIVATHEREEPTLQELYRRGTANGVTGLQMISASELAEIEPHASGVAALHVPGVGVVDFRHVALAMAHLLQDRAVEILTESRVEDVKRNGSRLSLTTPKGTVIADFMVNCGGLHADLVARKMGAARDVQIVPFRGEYYLLRPDRRFLVKGLIYPVPNPMSPFLGVHLTRTIHGEVEAGPNAVLAFAREGYTKGTMRPSELWATLRYQGWRKLARRHWKMGLGEMRRSFSKRAFVAKARRLVPELRATDVVRGGAGVRAQAVATDGRLIDDFVIEATDLAVHVLNAPSPAATAALAIGEQVALRVMAARRGAVTSRDQEGAA